MIRDLKINYHTVSLNPMVNPRFSLTQKSIEWEDSMNGGKPIEVIMRWPKDHQSAYEAKKKYMEDALKVPGAFIISTLPVVYVMGGGEHALIQLHFRDLLKVEEQPSLWSDFLSHDLLIIAKAVKLVVEQRSGNQYVKEDGKEIVSPEQTIHPQHQ